MMRSRLFAVALATTLLGHGAVLAQVQRADAADVQLKATDHPRLPADVSKLWMVPPRTSGRPAGLAEFATAVKLEVDADFARALPILSTPAVQQSLLGSYAEYYKGLAELRLGRTNDAKRTFQALASKEPTGYLAEAAPLREAESDEALGDHAAALDIYERLAKTKLTAPDDVLMRLARAAKAVGNKEQAADANARDGVRPYIEKASRQGEALFFYAVATRELGDVSEYQRIIRQLADEFTT